MKTISQFIDVENMNKVTNVFYYISQNQRKKYESKVKREFKSYCSLTNDNN